MAYDVILRVPGEEPVAQRIDVAGLPEAHFVASLLLDCLESCGCCATADVEEVTA